MKKIVVIEDALEVQQLIADVLSAQGFQVSVASNGSDGLKMARASLPDLILCDVQMPGLDGYQVLHALRENPATATIPFILLSGVADKGNVRHGMELGADDFLSKPFTLEELIATVRTRLEKQTLLHHHSEQKLRELRGSITLAMPHEFMTPLNSIIGYSSLLNESSSSLPPEEVREYSGQIHHAAQRLQRLIENFLLYSQIEVAASDPEKVAALRRQTPDYVRETIVKTAKKKAVEARREADLVIQVAEACLPIPGRKLQKVVAELTDNALKFSPTGSQVRVVGVVQGSTYHLAVSDHGSGLNADQIALIGAHMQFERKIQEQQGSGLGLTIARRLVELYGGELEINSQPSVGTTVTVNLAVVDQPQHRN